MPSSLAGTGPWGRLTLTPIVISPPLELVSVDWGPVQPPRWFFPSADIESVARLLESSGIPAGDVARLRAGARIEPRIGGVVLLPDPAWVRTLTSDVRSRIYRELAKSGLNFDQAQAFRFRGSALDEWFGAGLISPATRALVEPLIYRDADYLLFADIELIRPEIGDAAVGHQDQRPIVGLERRPHVQHAHAVPPDRHPVAADRTHPAVHRRPDDVAACRVEGDANALGDGTNDFR